MKSPVEGSDAGKRDATVGSLNEQPPEHRDLVGDARAHDRVVDVADEHVSTTFGWNEDLATRLDPLRLLENEIHDVPGRIGRRFGSGMKVNPEVAVAISRDAHLGAAEPGRYDRAGNRTAHETTADIAQLQQRAIVAGRTFGLPEYTTNQEDLLTGSIASIGLENHAILTLRETNRPGHEAQDPVCCSCPAFKSTGKTHGQVTPRAVAPSTRMPGAQAGSSSAMALEEASPTR